MSIHHHWEPLPEQLAFPIDERVQEQVILQAESEFRVEVDSGHHIKIELISGFAQIFGAELPRRMPVLKSGPVKFAIFSWQGAKLVVTGKMSSHYISSDTPMVTYLNVHLVLTELRKKAQSRFKLGPSILVTGRRFSGKSTFCHILINYALKTGWSPLYADLNVKSNDLAPPGCVGVVLPEFPIPHESLASHGLCWFNGASPAPTAADTDKPHFRELYQYQLSHLAASVQRRLAFNLNAKRKELLLPPLPPQIIPTDADVARGDTQKRDIGGDLELTQQVKECVPYDPTLFASGCIVNALAQTGKVSEELLFATVQAFSTDLVLVLDDDRLYNALLRHCKDMKLVQGQKPPTVLKLPKSGGVVTPPASSLSKIAVSRISDYFSGPLREFSEIEISLSLKKHRIYKVGGVVAPLTALPQGESRILTHLQITPVDPATTPLTHRILAGLFLADVSKAVKLEDAASRHGSGPARDQLCKLLLSANVAALYLVKEYIPAQGVSRSEDAGFLNVLSPIDSEPPSPFLIYSDLQINPLQLHEHY